jgi:murein DD-endopeptidase MepM/ murein hydrolase activator NlpD
MVKEPNQAGTLGSRLLASAKGTVSLSHYEPGAGHVVQINHGKGWYSTYIHLKKRSVSKGQRVRAGQTIGQVGRSGTNANKHPHLHYEQAYDANRDGRATWGLAGSERVKSVFNGKSYGGKNKTWRKVRSRNAC